MEPRILKTKAAAEHLLPARGLYAGGVAKAGYRIAV
jgi:hypothetical protein